MRLGDLDELKEEINREVRENRVGVFVAKRIFDIIDNAPTVELFCSYLSDGEVRQPCVESPCKHERPQGEWEEFIMPLPLSDNHYKIGVICSECNTTWDCSTNYCPHCGARMRTQAD